MESGSLKADRYRRWGMIALWTFVFLGLSRTAAKYFLSWDEPWWVEGGYNAILVPVFVLPILARRARPKRG